MNLAKKYEKTLRSKVSLRAVWLPGTGIRVGDIMLIQDGVLTSIGNLIDQDVPFEITPIASEQSFNLKSKGIRQQLVQNGIVVNLDQLDMNVEAELTISFEEENSYVLKTPELSGLGMENAIQVAREINTIRSWDHSRNYIVHKVWHAEDFVFLGSAERGNDVSFKGSGNAIRQLLDFGMTSGISTTGDQAMTFNVMGKSGPIVMQVFRVKRNGDVY